MKPGLTGLWQVNGRSDLSWEESVRLDLRYVENWSFALDLQILWKTISVMVREVGSLLARACDDVVIRIASQTAHECVSEISYLRTAGSSLWIT